MENTVAPVAGYVMTMLFFGIAAALCYIGAKINDKNKGK